MIVGLAGAVDPNQNVAVLCPLGMVTPVTDAVENCAVPKVAPGELLVRFTVIAPPVVIGPPAPVWRRTVIGPRFGVPDVAPETAGEIKTSFSVVIVRVNVWVAFGPTPFAALMHTVYVPSASAAGLPDSRPVLENVRPDGKVVGAQPLKATLVKVGAGVPDAVTWKLSAEPTEKLVELALVMAGPLGLLFAPEDPAGPVGAGAGVPGAAEAGLVRPHELGVRDTHPGVLMS